MRFRFLSLHEQLSGQVHDPDQYVDPVAVLASFVELLGPTGAWRRSLLERDEGKVLAEGRLWMCPEDVFTFTQAWIDGPRRSILGEITYWPFRAECIGSFTLPVTVTIKKGRVEAVR